MAYACIVLVIYRSNPWLNDYLAGFSTLWGQLLSVTTFTLTFFVNQSYALWRKCSELSRRLQGRLHDIGLNLATHADRKTPSDPSEPSTYTPAARQILELMSRYIRLFNLLTYASFTRSHRPILTPRGMRRLVERGLMTAQEREILVDASIPATQRHSAILMWMIRLYYDGREAGHIGGGSGFEQQTIEKFHIIRSQYGAIGDELQGRMPLAYAHIVQVLVDLILWMYPVMALSSGMSPFLAIIGTGLLTVSYQGLFDLAKQFLDPYDNENYGKGEDPLCVDTLIAETNAGSVRWMYGFEQLPFSAQRLKDGELYDNLLPVRGYSVDELAQMEEERIQKEKELEEQRWRDEERLKQEEAERLAMEEGEEEKGKADLESVAQNATAVLDDANPNITDGAIANFDKVEASGSTIATKSEMQIPAGATNTTTEGQPARPLHKVTTLAGGKAVTFKRRIPAAPVNPAVPLEVSKYLASLQKPAPAELERRIAEKVAGVNVEAFQELPPFDEIGPDGQEIRLSQILAAEEQEKEIEAERLALAYEEYNKQEAALVEAAENELKETEILNASAGVEDVDKVLERKDKKKGPPKYDQTRLDGISGFPLENLDASTVKEQPATIKDVGSYGVSQLFGRAGGPTPKASEDESVGTKSFAGMSELTGESIEDLPDSDTSDSRPSALNDGNDSDGEDSFESSSMGVPRHEEAGPDGKEHRSSEMLADEEREEEESQPVQNSPMSLDDYNVQVSEILAAAEEELLETEAILMAAPGADPLGWDYEDDQLRGESIEDLPDSDTSDSRPSALNDGNDSDGEDSFESSSMGVPRHEEAGPDGKEHRSSEMLADEEREEEESQPVQNSPMSLDDYNVQVSEILAAAEEELLETEAILMAAPGADPLGWDYEDAELMPMTNVTKATNDTKAEASVESEDLGVLEMDVDDVEDIDLEDMERNNVDEEFGTPHVDDSDESLNGEDDEEANGKTDEETAENLPSENLFLVTEMKEDVSVKPTLSTAEEEEEKESDKIEPMNGIDEVDSSGAIGQAGDKQASVKDDVEEDAQAHDTQDKNDTEDKKLTVGEDEGGDKI